MKLKVNANNEYAFTPDIGDNRKLPDGERFVVMLRRLNQTLHSGKWSAFGMDGTVSVDLKTKIRDHIIELKRPPVIDDGATQKELTVEMLLSDRYSELDDLVNQILAEINSMAPRRLNVDPKK